MLKKLRKYLLSFSLLILIVAYQNCAPGFKSLDPKGATNSNSTNTETSESLNIYPSVVFDVEKIQKDWGTESGTNANNRCAIANTELIPGEILYAPRENASAWRAPISDQVHRLTLMSDYMLRERNLSDSETSARCTLNFIYEWARRNSMTGDFSPLASDPLYLQEPEYEREYLTVLFLLVYSKLKNYPGIKSAEDLEKINVVETWLGRLTERVIAYSVVRENWVENDAYVSRNNHLYWEGLAAQISGYLFSRADYLQRAEHIFELALNQIQENGVLPLEMARGTQAFQYHLYATTPLILMAEISIKNGQNWYAKSGGKIHLTIHLLLNAIRDPVQFNSFFGMQPQSVTPTTLLDLSSYDAELFAWFEVYYKRFGSTTSELALQVPAGIALQNANNHFYFTSFLKGLRSKQEYFVYRRIGGNVTANFGVLKP